MDIMHAIILGIVEGVTEFLPVSSTGHMILTSALLKIPESEYLKTFEIAIQLGAILAVVALYPRRLFLDRSTMTRVIAGFIPTALLGLVFYKIIKHYLLGNTGVVIGALLLGGVAIILLERYLRGRAVGASGGRMITDLSLKESALIGAAQAIAFIPGVSRSAATIFSGMWLGLTRKEAVEYSFFIAVPTMAAATGLDLLKSYHELLGADIRLLLVGFVVSFATALLALKFLMRYVTTNDFMPFGVYRIVVAIVLAMVLL